MERSISPKQTAWELFILLNSFFPTYGEINTWTRVKTRDITPITKEEAPNSFALLLVKENAVPCI